MKIRLIVIFFILTSVQHLLAQPPKYSNEFLAIGVGGRALGMANSVVASVNDISSTYWNPAGLMHIENNIQLMFMHSNYFSGIAKYDYGALGFKIDENSRAAVSFIRFGVDDIPNTLDLIDEDGNVRYDRISSFSVADNAFIFSYARRMPIEGLEVGGNVKVIRRIVGEFADAWGFGIDVGAQYKLNDWQFAAVGKDITSTFNAWTFYPETFEETFIGTGNEVPENSVEITMPRLLLGAARKFVIKEKISILPEINFDCTFDGKRNVLIKSNTISIDPHLGLEIGYKDFVYVRGGLGQIQDLTDIDGNRYTDFQPNIGIGIQLKYVVIDYAMTSLANRNNGLYSNLFSIKLNINKQPKTNKKINIQ